MPAGLRRDFRAFPSEDSPPRRPSLPRATLLLLDRIRHEDLALFLRSAAAATGQSTWAGAEEQHRAGVEFLHAYARGAWPTDYLRALGAGINDHHRQRIVIELLAHPTRHPDESSAILRTLATLPTNRAWAALHRVAERGVTNRRARAIVRDFVAARHDLAFEVVKYRRHVRAVLRHFHLHPPGELGDFLFSPINPKVRFTTPILETFRAARYSDAAVFDLPWTVAEGLAARRGLARERLLAKHTRMTRGERARLQDTAAAVDVDLGVQLRDMPLTRLCLYLLSWPSGPERERPEVGEALRAAARRVLVRRPLSLGRVGLVLDRSVSTSGARATRRRPLAVALGIEALLREASTELTVAWTPGSAPAVSLASLQPVGATDLVTPLLEVLEAAPDLVVIVSDGAENTPPGGAEGVARLYRAHLRSIPFVHVNPVFDGELLQPRPLAPATPEGSVDLPTLGLRDAEDLPGALTILRASPPWGSPAQLDALLADGFDRLLGRAS